MSDVTELVQRLRAIEFGAYAFDAPVVERYVKRAADALEAQARNLEAHMKVIIHKEETIMALHDDLEAQAKRIAELEDAYARGCRDGSEDMQSQLRMYEDANQNANLRIAELEAALKAVADLEPDLPFYIWGQINNAVPSKARPSKALPPPQEGE